MKNTLITVFVFLFSLNNYLWAQGVTTNEMKKVQLVGSLLYRPDSKNVYLVTNNCDDRKIYRLQFDDKNWETTWSGGSKLQQKMAAAMIGKEKMAKFRLAEIRSLRLIGNNLEKIFQNSNNSFKIVSNSLSEKRISFLGSDDFRTLLQLGEFVETTDGSIMIKADEQFKVFLKESESSEPVEIFAGDLNLYNSNSILSISYDFQSEITTVVTKGDPKNKVVAYNSDKKLFYPEQFETEYNYAKSADFVKGLSKVPAVFRVFNIEKDSSKITYNVSQLSDIDKKGNFDTPKKPINESLKLDSTRSKDFSSFMFAGGRYLFNDTLVGLFNFDNWSFDGYFSDESTLVLTKAPYDPRQSLSDFVSTKTNYDDLIEMCPNAPYIVKQIIDLNSRLDALKKRGAIDNAKIKRFQFIVNEVKSQDGSDLTEIKILKDCNLFDLNDDANRKAISELVNEVRANRAAAMG